MEIIFFSSLAKLYSYNQIFAIARKLSSDRVK